LSCQLRVARVDIVVTTFQAMVRAAPVEGVAYRKSQRSQQAYDQAAKKQDDRASPSVRTESSSQVTPPAPTATAANGSTQAVSSRTRSGTTPEMHVPARGAAEPTPKRARRTRETRGSSSAAATSSNAISSTTTETLAAETAATATAIEGQDETIGLTLESTREIRAPAGTIIDAEAQIAQSKADVLRLKHEAEVKAAAGQTPEEMGLIPGTTSTIIDAAASGSSSVPSSLSTNTRGLKRTAGQQAEDESTEIVGSTIVLPGSTAERVIRRRNGRIVEPEQARRRGAVMGAVMFVGGALGAWAYQALL
jgi:hypothetical protein